MIPRSKAFWLLVAVLPTLPGCGETSAPGVEDGSLADTLTALIGEAYDFERPGTLERMSALYANSDQVVSASGGQMTVSADSVQAGIRRFWLEAGQNMQGAEWRWEEVQVRRLSPDAAVLTGTWSIPHTAPDGQPHVIEGAWTAVFQRLDGEWKIVHEHLSAPPS